MKKEIKISVPNNYSAITLKKYLEMHKDMEAYKDDEEAVHAILFYHLCQIEADTLQKIDNETYNGIKNQLFSFLGNHEHQLKRIVVLNGKEYGFEPNLSEMAYGAYVDISKYDTFTIDENWAKVMSILYRPITKKVGALYEIEPYNGYIDEELWLEAGMDIHFGAYFFFINLSRDLGNDILKSLMQTEEMPTSIKSILEKSGELTNQYLHFLTGSYSE